MMQLTIVLGVERKHFDDAPCPIARALAVFGDWWTPLIIRECLYGVHRFDELQSWLGISRNILTRRLDTLLTQGILERRQYQEKPVRHEYHLTDKGYDAANLLIAMMPLGDAWYFAKGREPIRLYSRKTDRRVRPVLVDADTGEPIDARELYAGPGPSFPKSPAIRRKRFAEYFARVGRGDHR